MRFASHIYKSNLNGLFIDYTERKLSGGSALINEYTEQMILMIHFLKISIKTCSKAYSVYGLLQFDSCIDLESY